MVPLLSIIVPVFNEEATLATIMEAITLACPENEIIYVDDGSTDHSYDVLRKNARPQDRVITKRNGGKGSAIREGIRHISGQYTVIQDADLEYDPQQIHALLAAAQSSDGIVFGSRFLQSNPNIYRRYLWGNKFITACMNVLFSSHLTDSYTCYKLLPTALFQSLQLQSDGFELEAEICAKCLKRGLQIREIPIVYQPRTHEEGKKISGRDGWKALWTMLRIRLGRNYSKS